MLTAMTEENWTIVLRVFAASRSRRGDKGRNDRKLLEALHYFVVHNITWRALPEKFGLLERRVEAVLAAELIWNFRSVLRCPGSNERDGAFGTDVRFHRGARPCLGSGRKGGSMIRRLAARVAFSLPRFT
jgi:hypothetical protein